MPSLSLVVCVHRERDLFERLLHEAAGCCDDLVVVHDGTDSNNRAALPSVDQPAKEMALDYGALVPDAPLPTFYNTPPLPARSGSIHELVMRHQGRYFEGPHCFQQEPHWPFAWWQAKHDWILRLDADEFPSEELKSWLRRFRDSPEPNTDTSGYSCIWPLWNGTHGVTTRWPTDRIFLLHRRRVRFFGMVEQVPIPDRKFEALQLILEHRPKRKSYGFSNLLLRKQAYDWRRVIARSLLGKPTDLQCWRWASEQWPTIWEEIRQRPVRTAFYRLMMWPLFNMRRMKRVEGRVILSAVIFAGVHHCIVAVMYWQRRFSQAKT
jgi:hypothetical protein